MSVIDDILAESEKELGLDKIANGPNGEPENSSNSDAGKQDINAMANAFMQKVEQFKAQVGQGAVGAGEDQGAIDPNQQAATQQAGVVDPNAQAAQGAITVQTPGGAVVKIASLVKLAALKGSDLFKEVK